MAVEHGCSVLRTVSPLASPRLKVGSAMPRHVNNTKGYLIGFGRRIITRKVGGDELRASRKQ